MPGERLDIFTPFTQRRDVNLKTIYAVHQIGAEYVARSTPDGYTLLVSAEATFVVNPWLYSRLPYRLMDFAPITGLVSISQSLIASPSVPANSLNELIALARQRPGELNYGTFGIGSTGELHMPRNDVERRLMGELTGAESRSPSERTRVSEIATRRVLLQLGGPTLEGRIPEAARRRQQ